AARHSSRPTGGLSLKGVLEGVLLAAARHSSRPTGGLSLKGVLEGVLLAAHQAAEVDQLVLERDLVFSLQIYAVERRIIGAEAVIDSRLVELSRHLAYGSKVCKSPGLQVRARTEFETDAPLA